MKRVHRIVRTAASIAALAMPALLVWPPARPIVAPLPVLVETGSAGPSGGPPLFAFDPSVETGMIMSAVAPPQPVGIVGRLPDDGRALVRLADGSVRTLAVGESAQGWTLAGIAADRLRVRRGAEERTLVLPIAPAGGDQ